MFLKSVDRSVFIQNVKIILTQGSNESLLYMHYTPDISLSSRANDHRAVIFNRK